MLFQRFKETVTEISSSLQHKALITPSTCTTCPPLTFKSGRNAHPEFSTSILISSCLKVTFRVSRHYATKFPSTFTLRAALSQIVIGAGTQQLTTHLCHILRRMNIGFVCTEDPGYVPIQKIFHDNGFGVNKIPVSSDGIRIDMLPANIASAVYVSPANQFPTGSVMSIASRYKLLSWANQNNSIILEYDYDSELRYFGKPIPALQGLDKDHRVVYFGSFSSTLFPAIKVSYMILPTKMAEIFASIKSGYTQTCSKTEQLTLALFMENGYYYTNIRRLRSLYAQKLQLAISSFAKYGAGFIEAKNTKSGINIILDVKSEKSAETLCQEAESLRLYVATLNQTTENEQKNRQLIFYYNQIPIDLLEDSIKNLTELWAS